MKKLILCLLLLVGCKQEDNSVGPASATVTDIDGNVYNTVIIGTQTWMVENLKVTKFNDGLPIPQVSDSAAWSKFTLPGYCWYNNDPAAHKATYGALYNWYAVGTGKLAPRGWHVPTDDEWTKLEMFLGMTPARTDSWGWRGTTEGRKLKDTLLWLKIDSGWIKSDTGATNSSGFTALPAGYRWSTGSFYDKGGGGYWWSSTDIDASAAYRRHLAFYSAAVHRGHDYKDNGFSVRCVKD